MFITSIRSTRIVLPDGVRAATVHVDDGRVAAIGPYSDAPRGGFDAGDLIVLPGLVDTHVHANEPGRTEWEGFETATRAAAAGGVATIVDMPLNSVPATTTVAALEEKRASARGKCHVDVAFWGGVVPGNAGDVESLAAAGVRGFKCFLAPSGVDEFPAVGEADLRQALPVVARARVPLLVHAELPASLYEPAGPGYAEFLASRPPQAEVEALRLMVRLAREFGARVHIVHVASAEAASEIARAKQSGVAITAETCPHYLSFDADEIPAGATEFKCAPPIREARHRAALWQALADGTLDLVVSDHSPSPPALKCRNDFGRAWGGIASLELGLSAVWTSRQHAPAVVSTVDIARWMAAAPARLAGLDTRKGRIAAGFDADFSVWDSERTLRVDPLRLQQRHKLTPYAGRLLNGAVVATFVRGACVWNGGRHLDHPAGRAA